MAQDIDEYGVPIKSAAQSEVDEYGVPIKKKSPGESLNSSAGTLNSAKLPLPSKEDEKILKQNGVIIK